MFIGGIWYNNPVSFHDFSPKRFLFSLTLALLASLCTFILVIANIDPNLAGFWGVAAFYLSLFLFCVIGFTFLGYGLRVLFTKNSPLAFFAKISLRQGILLAFLFLILLFLQSLGSLTLLSVILLSMSLILLEIAFLTH